MTDTLTRTETILEERGRPTLPTVLAQLSKQMRRVLIEHLDGPRGVAVETTLHNTVTALVRKRLLKLDGFKAPRRSMLTARGRDAAAICSEFEASRIIELENEA